MRGVTELSFHLCWCYFGGKKLLWTEYSPLSGQGCLKNLQVRSSGKFLSRGPHYNDPKAGQIARSRLKGEEVTGNASWKQGIQMQGLPACSRTHLMVNCIFLVLVREYTDASIRVARYHHVGVALGSTVHCLPPFPCAYKTKEALFAVATTNPDWWW